MQQQQQQQPPQFFANQQSAGFTQQQQHPPQMYAGQAAPPQQQGQQRPQQQIFNQQQGVQMQQHQQQQGSLYQQQQQQQPQFQQQQQPFTAAQTSYFPQQQPSQQQPSQQQPSQQQPSQQQPHQQQWAQQQTYTQQQQQSHQASSTNEPNFNTSEGSGQYDSGQVPESVIKLIGAGTEEEPGIEVHVRQRRGPSRSTNGSTPSNWSGAIDGSGSMRESMHSSRSMNSSNSGSEAGDVGHNPGPNESAPIQPFQAQQYHGQQGGQQQPFHMGGGVPLQQQQQQPNYVQQHPVTLPPVPQLPPGFGAPQPPHQQQPGGMYPQQQPHPGMLSPQQVQQMGMVGGPGGGGAQVRLGMVPPMPSPMQLQQPPPPPPMQQQKQQKQQQYMPPTNLAQLQPGQDPNTFAASLLGRLREETQDSNLELMVNNLTFEQLQALMGFLNTNATTVLHLCEKERGKVLTQVLVRTHGVGCEEMIKSVCSNLAFLATHRVGCVAITRTVKALIGDNSTSGGGGGGRGGGSNNSQQQTPSSVTRTPQQEASAQACLDLITQSALRLLPDLAKHDHGNFVCSAVLGKSASDTAFSTAWTNCFKVRPDFFVECACSKAGSHVVDAFVTNAPKMVLEEVIQFVFVPRPDYLTQMASSAIANYPMQGLIRTLRSKLIQHAYLSGTVAPGQVVDASMYGSAPWVWLQESIPKFCLSSPHYTNILVALTGEGSGPMRRRKESGGAN